MTVQDYSYDVIIAGGGVVGCGIARELSRLDLKIALLEKEPDVGWGASCRNSGVVHAGYNNTPGTLMARFCVEGNQGFEALCAELDVPFKRVGKLVVADGPDEVPALERLKKQGETNGVRGLEMIDGDRVRELEPHLEHAYAAMYSPNSAITSPYLLTIALAENALANGVDIFLNSRVEKIKRIDPVLSGSETEGGSAGFIVHAGGREFRSRILINSAGVQSAEVSRLAGADLYTIYPCRGEYYVLDTYAGELVHHLVYPVPKPGSGGLGIHLTPTIDGNILIGPSNEYIDFSEDYSVTAPVMKTLSAEARSYMPQLNGGFYIRSFAGMRAKQTPPEKGGYYDYVIKEEETCPGLINLVGIESPGLTASMPIARYVSGIVRDICERGGRKAGEKPHFKAERTAPIRFAEQDDEVKAELIAEDPDYGEIICRCEQVTRKEIRQAIENPLGARSLNSIKYRSRAMMGRCQGGYCTQRILQILRDEYGVRPDEIELGISGSWVLSGGRCDIT
ncbi:MAG: NAD(P)/FAD-dependent oxidoreductase [Sediminispirochaetaceae bacterium]